MSYTDAFHAEKIANRTPDKTPDGKGKAPSGTDLAVKDVISATVQQKDCCDVAAMIHKSSIPLDTEFEHEGKKTTLKKFLSDTNPDVLKSHKGQEERRKVQSNNRPSFSR